MSEHLDVLIVGAGLSGIGAACHLIKACPDKTFAIVEARFDLGGTWDLFRYPGVRSDSDMFTLGYSFRPWTEPKSIADGPSILRYLRETAREFGLERHIRYGRRVVSAAWSSTDSCWTVKLRRSDSTGRVGINAGTQMSTGPSNSAHPGNSTEEGPDEAVITCSFLAVCSGYYRYDQGYTPIFPGQQDFRGAMVHPQHWPANLEIAGKRVVVIGSGATAMTVVPAMAAQGAQVTMLQRSPTYVAALPAQDAIADRLRGRLPDRWLYPMLRWKNVLYTAFSYQLSRRRPNLMRSILRKRAASRLPAGFNVDKHFGPSYNPWDQRLCVVPDGDLFNAIKAGTATIVTDGIRRFDAAGVELLSGAHLAADIIVTATGLNVLAIGGIALDVDGKTIRLAETLAYKGMMLSGVPNFSLTVGYTNASWTLKSDLVAQYMCRILRYMDAAGYRTVTPVAPDLGPRPELAPLIDLQSGYILRSVDKLPKQGPSTPWRLHQNYLRDVLMMRRGRLDDGVVFG